MSIKYPNQSLPSMNWSLSDLKGRVQEQDEVCPQEDIVSCLQFNSSGTKIACGDHYGRVTILERDAETKQYNFYNTYRSHSEEFDPLRSAHIDTKIVKLEWVSSAHSDLVLSANEKRIKLWKTEKRPPKNFQSFNQLNDESDYSIVSNLKHDYKGLHHRFNIHSLSMNNDNETFLSADELSINIWNLNTTNKSFLCVDAKSQTNDPDNFPNIGDYIQVTRFHPQKCNLFAYGVMNGVLKLCDMRMNAHCENPVKLFEDTNSAYKNSQLGQIIRSPSDLQFTPDGRYMVVREYMNVKVYDLNMDSEPVETYNVHEHLNTRLKSLFKSEHLFDQFRLSISPDNRHIITGSYGTFRIIDRQLRQEVTYDLGQVYTSASSGHITPKKVSAHGPYKKPRVSDEVIFRHVDISKKVFSCAWNPLHNEIVLACNRNLYVLNEKTVSYEKSEL